eukprot:3261679-Pyramimonas_sp.AAC.1
MPACFGGERGREVRMKRPWDTHAGIDTNDRIPLMFLVFSGFLSSPLFPDVPIFSVESTINRDCVLIFPFLGEGERLLRRRRVFSETLRASCEIFCVSQRGSENFSEGRKLPSRLRRRSPSHFPPRSHPTIVGANGR